MQDFTILVLPCSYSTSVSITLDMLHAASAMAPGMKLPKPAWRIVSPEGGRVSMSNGIEIQTERMPVRHSRDASTWIIPGLGVSSASEIGRRFLDPIFTKAIARVRRHVDAGGSVAASCSSVFLLQAAGLLRNRRATTSWWLAAELRRLEPACAVDAGRMVVNDGLITTAGAAFGQSDLMLYLIRTKFSAELADIVGKLLLIDGRQAQSRFIVPTMLANGNELIARLTHYIESSLPELPSVNQLAKAFAMSDRTLSRHVKAVTGHGPMALIQAVRLSRARQLIENSKMSVDQVATAVGYRDSTALRRLMRKTFGVNPSVFRVDVNG